MRDITIPKPVELIAAVTPQSKTIPKLTLLDLVRDDIGKQPGWRENESSAVLYLDIVEELEAHQTPGDIATLTNEQWEKLLTIMRAFDPSPAFAHPYMKLFRCVAAATKSKDPQPEAAAETNGAPAAAPAA